MKPQYKRKYSSSSSESEDDEQKRTLFVANLHSETSEEIFFELFLQAGPIERVNIPKDKETNRQKPFGFVTYKYSCAVPYAIQLYDGIKLFGQRLTIKARIAKDSHSSNSQRQNNSNSSLKYGSALERGRSNNCKEESKDFMETLQQISAQLADNIRNSFDKPSSSRCNDNNYRNDRLSSRWDSRHNNREKPYERYNNNDRHKHNKHRNDRRSNQRRNR